MKKNHYEVLNLARNCSAKEIKDSYIKLSKRYHPDLNNNNDKEAHKKFVEINEAYSVLSKNSSRRCYDDLLSQRQYYSNTYTTPPNRTRVRYENPYDYYHRQSMNARYEFTSSANFSNSSNLMRKRLTSLIFCCFLISVGTAIQLSALRRNVEQKSYLAAVHLQQARARGENRIKNGLPVEELFQNVGIAQSGDNKN